MPALLTSTMTRRSGRWGPCRAPLAVRWASELVRKRLNLSTATWLLDLEREFVFVGDGGFTELSRHSRRYGLDLETRLGLTS